MTNQGAVVLRSNPVAPDPRVEKLARILVKSGRIVFIVGWDRSGDYPKQEESTSTGIIFRMRLKAAYGSGLINFPRLFIWQLYLSRWLVSHRRDYEVIHACDFDTVIPALLAGKLLKKKVIFDIFDLYSDSVRNTPGWILKMISSAERQAINSADVVILADDSRREQIAGSAPKKLVVVYNSPERNMKGGWNDTAANGEFRLVYVGLLVKERSLSNVIEIVGRHPDWRFDLAGFGGDEEEIVRLAVKYRNINWHGRVEYNKALTLMAKADLLFAIYDPAVPNHRYSSPNKVFEAMLLEKPLVVARGTNMDRIVEAYNCGVVVNFGDVGEIEAVFERLSKEKSLCRQMGINSRKAYELHYSWKLMGKRIVALYNEL